MSIFTRFPISIYKIEKIQLFRKIGWISGKYGYFCSIFHVFSLINTFFLLPAIFCLSNPHFHGFQQISCSTWGMLGVPSLEILKTDGFSVVFQSFLLFAQPVAVIVLPKIAALLVGRQVLPLAPIGKGTGLEGFQIPVDCSIFAKN